MARFILKSSNSRRGSVEILGGDNTVFCYGLQFISASWIENPSFSLYSLVMTCLICLLLCIREHEHIVDCLFANYMSSVNYTE